MGCVGGEVREFSSFTVVDELTILLPPLFSSKLHKTRVKNTTRTNTSKKKKMQKKDGGRGGKKVKLSVDHY